ncbi:MAG TPA: hypothetical protein O0X70_00550 [Methanocorpusculum sp.]|nr:hypothetical protein [Methanocorpusculum sp.]
MKFLEHELAAQERDLAAKQEKTAAPASEEIPAAPASEDLELRVRELEAMVKGLTSELLDLKSVCRRLSTQIEKLGGAPVKSHPENAARFGVRRPAPEAEPAVQEPAEVPVTRGRIQPAVPETPARNPQRTPARQEVPVARHTMRQSPQPKAEEVPRRVINTPVPEPQKPAVEEVPAESLGPGEFEYVMQPDGSIQKRRKTHAANVIIAGTGFNPGHASRSSAIRADSNAVIEAEEDDTLEIK